MVVVVVVVVAAAAVFALQPQQCLPVMHRISSMAQQRGGTAYTTDER